MKKKYLKILFFCFFSTYISSSFCQNFLPCAHEFNEKISLLEKENITKRSSKEEKALEIHLEKIKDLEIKKPLKITIPVVFHILQTPHNETFPMSDAWVMQQFNYLNWAIDQGNANNFYDIDFCLAQFDDANEPMPIIGIDRIDLDSNLTSTDYFSYEEILHYNTLVNSIMPSELWDPYKYYNIWMCPVLKYGYGFGGYISGISHLPGNAILEGIDFGADQLSSIYFSSDLIEGTVLRATSADYYETLIAHETGHWLGGLHTFGNTGLCDPGDYCSDTYREVAYHGCTDQNKCGDPDPIDNFMSYHNNCANTFTTCQFNERFFKALIYDPMRYSVWQHSYLCDSSTWLSAQLDISDAIFCTGDSIIFADYIELFVPSDYTVYYSISTDDGLTWSPIATNPFHYAISPITEYIVQVTAINGSGQTVILGELNFTAYTIADCYWPPNDDPVPHTVKLKNLMVNAFPNPAYNLINVQSNYPIEQVIVTNATKMHQVKYGSSKTLDISNFDSGILFLQVQLKNGQVKVLKILKQ